MADVFGRKDSPFMGAFSADNSTLTIGGFAGGAAAAAAAATGTLVQNLQVNYTQTINQIFEVGSAYRYYVVGRTNGTIAFGRIVGPSVVSAFLLSKLGDVCGANAPGDHEVVLTLGNSACQFNNVAIPVPIAPAGVGQSIELKCEAVVATSVGYSVQAQDMMINENVQCICGQVSRKP